MSSSLLLQQCPACLVRLTCIVFVMGGKWPYSWCLVGCCRQDLDLTKVHCFGSILLVYCWFLYFLFLRGFAEGNYWRRDHVSTSFYLIV